MAGVPSRRAQLEANAKAARGESLTAEEREAKRAYEKSNRQRKMDLYWPTVEEREEIQRAAEEAGYKRVSAFLVAMVRRGMQSSSRTIEEWTRLEEQVRTAEKRLEQQLEMTHELMAKASKYEAERDEARQLLFEAEAHARDLQERIMLQGAKDRA